MSSQETPPTDLPTVLTFDEAITQACAAQRHVHLLLGNGFSIACRPDTFRYEKLLDEADFSKLSVDASRLFEFFDTANFEQIIRVLNLAAQLVRLYRPTDPAFADALERDADLLKDALAEVLARTHPEMPASITDEEYERAATFISHFASIYTVNYDLLLYWTVMWALDQVQGAPERDDGFRAPDGDPDADYVAWRPFADLGSQNVHYLHGGLHLFDAGRELRKFTWVRTGIRLITQIRDALDANQYPLVVTEGTSPDKLNKIMHHGYLTKALRSLGGLGSTTALFVYGLSLADNDEHILDAIAKSKLGHLFVGLYGDPASDANQEIIARARRLAERRRGRTSLAVSFYDSESAHVWR